MSSTVWPTSPVTPATASTLLYRNPSRTDSISPSDSGSAIFDFGATSPNIHIAGKCSCVTPDNSHLGNFRRRHSSLANSPMMSAAESGKVNGGNLEPLEPRRGSDELRVDELRNHLDKTLSSDSRPPQGEGDGVSARQFEPAPEEGVGESSEGRRKGAPHMREGSLAMAMNGRLPEGTGASVALNDTPSTTAPGSPESKGSDYFPEQNEPPQKPAPLPLPLRQNSGTSTPRVRPTTLDIPGLTKSKVSPDGRIASRDVGAKLVIVMVGLPARGKSYITKKLARYLNWLQHDTTIFNVGERRRVAAGGPNSLEKTRSQEMREAGHRPSVAAAQQPGLLDHTLSKTQSQAQHPENPASVAQIVLNGETKLEAPSTSDQPQPSEDSSDALTRVKTGHRKAESRKLSMPDMGEPKSPLKQDPDEESNEGPQEPEDENQEHNAAFFDPNNKKASAIREQVARETLDELLDYIMNKGGSVGILDATNSTMERRKMIMDQIREKAGPELNVLFLESTCVDQDLLESNMRLKLKGPDYKDMDPTVALEDFRQRVQVYEKAYVPLGEYEEKNNMPYIQMIDVGRKIISHQIKGFLSAQANYYLLNFNLAPRQIWITRHGLSQDNISGKIGGDSDLAPEGNQYARSLARFIDQKRREWDLKQYESLKNTHFPPQPGDSTPPNPYYSPTSERAPGPVKQEEKLNKPMSGNASPQVEPENVPGYEPKAFCVWTSMLKRSIQTAQYFSEEEYDTKQMRMLDELNAGVMEGLTYSCISTQFPDEFKSRKQDKLHYRYPGPGGEGYLDIINRLRPVIVELERMTDHVLLVGHRSVARVLLAYFRGLKREEVADLDVPLGMLYCLEPKPYGVDFKAFRWDKSAEWFYEVPDFQLKRAEDDMQ
ncbi:bifunctional 6-phosphofructo-2-kinase/fructose-2,6-bisphosphate 2-phosphatase [Hortaea werneckii]|nr:bifunctional 6-phosphofructo-2-kinase/fructose-2,6-bisphosphate 2-phosphatase [Hortaea werneckii]